MTDKIKVFLSYLSEDNKVADVVKRELEVYSERIEVFKADKDLRAGVNYKTQLREMLQKSDWVLLLYTDENKDWQWPIFESSYFVALNGSTDKDSRMCFLYDSDSKPKPFTDYQGYRTNVFEPDLNEGNEAQIALKNEFYRNSPLFHFFTSFLSYPQPNPIRDEIQRSVESIINSIEKISEAFLENRSDTIIDQNYYLPRMEIELRNWTIQNWDDVFIDFGPKSQVLFQLVKSRMNWREFKDFLLEHSENNISPLWISQLEESIVTCQTTKRIPMPMTALMYSSENRRFYRPQLSRMVRYQNNDSRAYIMFVEQLPTDFSHHDEMGILLAGLISGGRFKFDFIDRRLQQLNKGFDDDVQFDDFGENVLNQIVGIEFEAAQHGLLEREPLLNVYPDSERVIVEGWYDEWHILRARIFEIFKEHKNKELSQEEAQRELKDILGKKLSALNSGFIRKASKTYYDKVNSIFT